MCEWYASDCRRHIRNDPSSFTVICFYFTKIYIHHLSLFEGSGRTGERTIMFFLRYWKMLLNKES